ncbi:hypothetical protein HZC53_00590 [Candidatus Uhrbacteria bacterium]|nr:hypothetical protein [Candidatus Uhrbacteria bacterium]
MEMTEIKLKTFMEQCLTEIAKRFNVVMVMRPGREPKIDVLDPMRYLLASQALQRLAPEADPKHFEINGDISPTHFTSMIGACLGVIGEDPKQFEYFAQCASYLETARNMTTMCFDILEGMEPDVALHKMDEADEGESLDDALLTAAIEAAAYAKSYIRWIELMFDPPYLTYAARAVEGLPPEQGKAILRTAFMVVNNSSKRPDADRFRDILRNTRDYIIACSEK